MRAYSFVCFSIVLFAATQSAKAGMRPYELLLVNASNASEETAGRLFRLLRADIAKQADDHGYGSEIDIASDGTTATLFEPGCDGRVRNVEELKLLDDPYRVLLLLGPGTPALRL